MNHFTESLKLLHNVPLEVSPNSCNGSTECCLQFVTRTIEYFLPRYWMFQIQVSCSPHSWMFLAHCNVTICHVQQGERQCLVHKERVPRQKDVSMATGSGFCADGGI